MRQAIHRPLHLTLMMLFGVVATPLLLHPMSSASAQQLTGQPSQETSRTGIQSRRLDNITPAPMRSVEKKDAQAAARKPHRLIRKPDSNPIATVEPSPSASLPTTSSTPQNDNPTSQPKEPSTLSRSVGAAMPLAAISAAPTPNIGSMAAGTAPTGSVPLAAASTANAGGSGRERSGGRTMRRLAAEMPRLAQLIAPPAAPAVSVAPTIGTSPTSLSFTAQQGSSNPAAQTLTISNIGGGILSWTASDSAAWMSLSSSSGTGAGSVTVSVMTGALTAGSYSGTVMLNATGASPVIVPVSFTVTTAPVAPAIGASPLSLSFTAQQGGANPATQALAISNTGGGTLTWTASDDAAWLSISPASGTGNGAVTVTAILGTLATGTHTGTITLSATGASSVSIPVTLTVTAAPVPPAIGASPTSLTFAATQGGANPANQTLTISNTGGGTLNWSVSDSAAWLTASPTSGTGNGAVTLTATTSTLTASSYTGTVTIAATGATSVIIPVTFVVAAPPAIGMSPSSLSFTAQQGGGNPAAQTLNISNTGGGTLSWSASLDTTWLAATPSSATGNGTVSIRVTTGTLTAGSYTGTITLSATGASNRTVPVTFTVTAAPIINLNPTSLSYAATQGASNPANQTVTLTMTGGATNWTVSDSVSWLSVTPTSGSGSSTVTSNANTAGLAAGTYTGTITVSATGALSKTVTVTLTINAPTTSSVTLTWAANTESDLAGYKVYRATSSGAYGAPLVTLTGNITSYVATGLQSGTTYFFVVTSYDSAGNESARSTEVSKSIF